MRSDFGMLGSCGMMVFLKTAVVRRVQVRNRTSVKIKDAVLIWWSGPNVIVRKLGITVAFVNKKV